ncbi:hypothetical protein Ssi03_08800 [Sphaerisporangium siamense]|uniref:Arc/MetJ-type ribon-helix-helix transcriptional regulator n=1 Tax=Sphaerisporangium siamense TaxID=795645 RepID=A0A7W7DFV4_9ACTN|nr:hypothetical protein [Sphaerisporangium siamense]MBB4705724.1 Arc/MetJ-type ribon-helix-helix transcriptional regulator [Sphaerisporangium siamense]GII82890.1 hypothetical protein Ssi03_08800 [Sphaerisporangium siamense]
MSGDRKARITITVDPEVVEYAEHLVETGKATSVAAVFNDAIAAKRLADQRALALLRERAREADPARVARMMAHVNRQLADHGLPKASGE